MPKRDPEATAELRTSLLTHARRLVERDGARALTMRALATEAGCAIGLPYKVFANREELVAELVLEEFIRLRTELDRWAAGAGGGTVGANLARYGRIMLDRDMPAWEMVGALDDRALQQAAASKAGPSGLLASFDATVRDYLAAEQRIGRIAPDVDVDTFGFLITGAIHNLLVAGPGYPRPEKHRLEGMLRAAADRLTQH
ncbi:MAG: TetR/AcrR family transcriptional regulator [Candidatus Limnocylindria bacterium]